MVVERARREAARHKTSSPEFVAWTRVELLMTEASPVPQVALRFLREIAEVLGDDVAEQARPFVNLPGADTAAARA
jgi:hypothetical protein